MKNILSSILSVIYTVSIHSIFLISVFGQMWILMIIMLYPCFYPTYKYYKEVYKNQF